MSLLLNSTENDLHELFPSPQLFKTLLETPQPATEQKYEEKQEKEETDKYIEKQNITDFMDEFLNNFERIEHGDPLLNTKDDGDSLLNLIPDSLTEIIKEPTEYLNNDIIQQQLKTHEQTYEQLVAEFDRHTQNIIRDHEKNTEALYGVFLKWDPHADQGVQVSLCNLPPPSNVGTKSYDEVNLELRMKQKPTKQTINSKQEKFIFESKDNINLHHVITSDINNILQGKETMGFITTDRKKRGIHDLIKNFRNNQQALLSVVIENPTLSPIERLSKYTTISNFMSYHPELFKYDPVGEDVYFLTKKVLNDAYHILEFEKPILDRNIKGRKKQKGNEKRNVNPKKKIKK